jgi:hypothetical protein
MEKHKFTDEERGRPTSEKAKAKISLNAQLHGFYVSSNFLCCSACKLKDDCSLKGKFTDWIGEERCQAEADMYKVIMAAIEEELEDEPLRSIHLFTANILVADYITFCRAHKYLTKKGLVTRIKIKDDKTGEIKEIDAQNILKRDMYYQKRSILDFLASLKLDRAGRDPSSQKFDLAIKFTSE